MLKIIRKAIGGGSSHSNSDKNNNSHTNGNNNYNNNGNVNLIGNCPVPILTHHPQQLNSNNQINHHVNYNHNHNNIPINSTIVSNKKESKGRFSFFK